MSIEESQSLRTIKPISLDMAEQEIEVFKKAFYSGKLSPMGKDTIQKKLGGMCVICGGLAQHIASYDCAGATRSHLGERDYR